MNLKSKFILLIFSVAMIMLVMTANVLANESGVVCTDALNVRADMSYEAQIIGVVYKGEELTILSAQDGWLKINYNEGFGFVSGQYVTLGGAPQAADDGGIVVASVLNIRSQPSFESEKMGQLVSGDVVIITGSEGDFYQIRLGDGIAYVAKEYIEVGNYNQLVSRSGTLGVSRSGAGSQVVEKAKEYMGTPYVYGGTSPKGFDCSGFTYYVYGQMGQPLARTAAAQANNGIKVSKDQLLPGDLVFFNTYGGISHVGIYVGNGQMIHAPNSGRTVSYDNINSGYYSSRYVTARRIVQ